VDAKSERVSAANLLPWLSELLAEGWRVRSVTIDRMMVGEPPHWVHPDDWQYWVRVVRERPE